MKNDDMTPGYAFEKYVVRADDRANGRPLALFFHGPLSQWWASRFSVDGTIYNCAEQYMMAQKAATFGDWSTHDKIMECVGDWDGTQSGFNRFPRLQKSLGREVSGFDDRIWKSVARALVFRANAARYSQNNLFRETLLMTGDATIVETSPSDGLWGIGLSIDDEDTRDSRKWLGVNWLGLVLTNLRDTLR